MTTDFVPPTSMQEVIDRVVPVLRARGWTRAGEISARGHFECKYRSPVGPCAIGVLLTDEEYQPEMDNADESNGVLALLERYGVLQWGLKIPDFKWLASGLQGCHDQNDEPADMERAFRTFVNFNHLIWPEEIQS